MLDDRKDPTWYGFLRYEDDWSIIEDQSFRDQNKNKIYFNNTNAQRINVLMAHDEMTGSFLQILYEFLFDSEKNKMKQLTSQNGKGITYPLTIIQGSRIHIEY